MSGKGSVLDTNPTGSLDTLHIATVGQHSTQREVKPSKARSVALMALAGFAKVVLAIPKAINFIATQIDSKIDTTKATGKHKKAMQVGKFVLKFGVFGALFIPTKIVKGLTALFAKGFDIAGVKYRQAHEEYKASTVSTPVEVIRSEDNELDDGGPETDGPVRRVVLSSDQGFSLEDRHQHDASAN